MMMQVVAFLIAFVFFGLPILVVLIAEKKEDILRFLESKKEEFKKEEVLIMEKEKKETGRPRIPRTAVVLTLLLAVCAFVGLSSLVVVDPDEYVLIKQFGRVVRVESEAGPTVRIPFVQTTQSIPKYEMIYDIAPSDVTTKDKKVLNVDSFVTWKITDPLKYLSAAGANEATVAVRIENAVYNATKNVMSSMTQEEIIENRDGELASEILKNVGTSLEGSYGIEILATETKKLDLPSSNKQAVYERMISERNNIAAQYTADGEYQSSLIINKTDRTARETVAKAEAEAEKIRADAEAQYMQILSDAYNNEDRADFYSFVRSLDALKASLQQGDKTVILGSDSELAGILSGSSINGG